MQIETTGTPVSGGRPGLAGRKAAMHGAPSGLAGPAHHIDAGCHAAG
jgi:hypothetical protein